MADDARQHETIERQADEDMKRRPEIACGAPSKLGIEIGGYRPTDGAGKTSYQRNTRDRATRLDSVDCRQRRERGFVETERHSSPKHEPCAKEQDRTLGDTQKRQSNGEYEIGRDQNISPAMLINFPACQRAKKGRHDERSRKRAENLCLRNPKITRHWGRDNGGKIVRRSPSKSLSNAQGYDEGSFRHQ